MSCSFRSKVALLALLPVAAIAQDVQQPNPADPGASVPTSSYVSAFKTYQTSPEEQATPDTTWRAANEQVENQDAHTGHAGMDMHDMKSRASAAPSGPAQAAAHANHGSDMSMPDKTNAASTNSNASQPRSEANHGSHRH